MRHTKTVPLAQWPDPLRQAWIEIPEKRWTRNHRARLEQAVGRWLKFLGLHGRPLLEMPTPARGEEYWDFLREAHEARRASDIFSLLFYAARVLWPAENWGWLRQLWHDKKPRRPRVPRKPTPRRLSVPIPDWPREHRIAWLEGSRQRDLGDTDGFARLASWEPATRTRVAYEYGQYLHCLWRNGLGDRISSEGVRALVNDARGRGCTIRAIASYVGSVRSAALALEPDRDWSWLGATHENIKMLARRSGRKRKHGRVVDPAEIWLLGMERIAAARGLRADAHAAALAFRNGLFMALIASVPLRIKNWAATEIGVQLDLDTGMLCFGDDETKEDRDDDRELTPELLALLDEWVAVYRPRLLRDPDCRHLWISNQGGPLTPKALSDMLGDATEAAFGKRISAQRARDCVATMIKERYPEETEVATQVLDHASSRMTREYQESARPIAARVRFRKLMAAAEAQLQPSYGLGPRRAPGHRG